LVDHHTLYMTDQRRRHPSCRARNQATSDDYERKRQLFSFTAAYCYENRKRIFEFQNRKHAKDRMIASSGRSDYQRQRKSPIDDLALVRSPNLPGVQYLVSIEKREVLFMSSAQITPDQAKFLMAAWLATLKMEHAITKRVIEAVPLDKG